MKPYIHAKNSVIKYGGIISDYIEIHNFIDSSKAVVPDMRHRAIFHSAFGCFIVEKVFGVTIINSDKQEVSTRDIAEDHILEDLGKIPTLQDWLSEMEFKDWMLSPENRKKIAKEAIHNPCLEIKFPEEDKKEVEEKSKPDTIQLHIPPFGPGLSKDIRRVMDGKRGSARNDDYNNNMLID